MDADLPNLRHLRCVAAIGRMGGIGRAAVQVSLTQPAVTQALARIEASVGAALFERRPGAMTLTEAGARMLPRIEAALAHLGPRHITAAQARALIAVARAGSYVEAARTIGLSEPSLHRALGALGLGLGRAVTERRGRGIVLTEAGRRAARAFALARGEYRAGLSEVAGLRGRETGRVSVGAMPLCRARLLPSAVGRFHAAHPQASVRIWEGSYAELIEPLRDGEIDVLIGAMRDPPPGEDVVQRALFEDRPVVIGRAGHPLAAGSADLAALGACSWVVPAPGAPLRLLWERMFGQAGEAPPPVRIECASVIAIRQMLLESDFLTLLSPDQVAIELAAGLLAQVRGPWVAPARTIGTFVRAGWRPTAMQAAFVDLLGVVATDASE